MRTARRSLALLLSLAACSPSASTGDAAVSSGDAALEDSSSPSPPTVTLPEGTVRGRAAAGYREFLGIPYAAPPVGPLRWRAPQPAAAWGTPREATTTPARCPQSLLGAESGQEDCLYLNVHTPNPAPTNAPVMVWLHGGGFTLGEGVQVDGGTRGDVLASTRGVVVVSVNYRLGALGFMAHPALTAEGAGHSGNYGLLDQRLALQWVRDHARAFGGDPSNVTIFGESAGGMSVCAHLASPMSAGLFQRAIVQSGPCGLPVRSLAQAESDGRRVAAALGCTAATETAACLRAAAPERVLRAIPTPPGFFSADPMYVSWGPIVDGAFYPETPMNRFRSGNFQRVPTLFGWNRDEGTLFVSLAAQTNLTAAQYPTAVRAVVGGDEAKAARVLERYSLASHPSPWQAYATVLGDFALRCAARRTLHAMLPHLPRAYAYQFDYANAAFQLMSEVPLGAFHSAEIQYVFGHPSRIGQSRFTGADLELQRAMQGYWARFAAGSDPNGEGAAPWPLLTPTSDASMVLDTTPRAGMAVAADTCAFWESLGLYP